MPYLNLQKTLPVPRKEGSNVRPKITLLDKAIRDLEKMVAECMVTLFQKASYYIRFADASWSWLTISIYMNS